MSNDPDIIRINSLKICNGASSAGPSEAKTPFLIGVAGGTASGKVCILSNFQIVFIPHSWCNCEKIIILICQRQF